MTRIESISSYIEDGELVLDIGCDQAHLSKLLAKRHIYSIASDLRENIIIRAQKNLTEEEKKYISFRIGDGITLKENEKNFTLVLSGMGTHLILNILKKYPNTYNKIITISNNNHDILRTNMLSLGYIVDKEEIIKEKNKYYNLIIFKKGHTRYTKEEEFIGINHQNKELLKERNIYLLEKYKIIINKIQEEKDRENLQNKISLLTNYNKDNY